MNPLRLDANENSETTHQGEFDASGKVESVMDLLRQNVGADAYVRWFGSAKIEECDAEIFRLSVPNEIHQVWIETNFEDSLRVVLMEVLGATPVIEIVVASQSVEPAAEAPAKPRKKVSPKVFAEAQATGSEPLIDEDKSQKLAKKLGLNPAHTFDRFVVGGNSQFAAAACKAVANQSGQVYNPLFIYGGSGLGKTHLMQAIGLERLAQNPKSKIIYLSSETFTNEFIDAVRKNGLDKFRARYRKADLLLLDDVQFLSGKERSQEEFFHTFNALFDSQCQIVLTSDRPASEIKSLSSRLTSRFEAGMTAEIMPPVSETREAILRRKMEEWNVNFDEDIVSLLVSRITNNVRRLVGALVRLATYTSLGEGAVSLNRAELLLKDILAEEGKRQINIDMIQRAVTERYDLRLADMTSRRRPASIAFPRQIAMYLSRKLTDSSLMDIGESFGGRDHGTVIHAIKRVETRITKENHVRDAVNALVSGLER